MKSGLVSLFSGQVLLKRKQYNSVWERHELIACWLDRYMGERKNLFIHISPFSSFIQDWEAMQQEKKDKPPKKYFHGKSIIADAPREPIKRHKAVYTNLSSPYGIYSETKNQFIPDGD